MVFQFLLNVAIMVIWVALQQEYTGSDFLIGYVLGMVIVYFFRGILNQPFYLRKGFAIIRLILLFTKELLVANYDMVKVVLNPNLKRDVKPGIIAVPTTLKHDWEITILSMLVTLTPGTLTMDYSSDARTLYITSFMLMTEKKLLKTLQTALKKPYERWENNG